MKKDFDYCRHHQKHNHHRRHHHQFVDDDPSVFSYETCHHRLQKDAKCSFSLLLLFHELFCDVQFLVAFHTNWRNHYYYFYDSSSTTQISRPLPLSSSSIAASFFLLFLILQFAAEVLPSRRCFWDVRIFFGGVLALAVGYELL